MPAKTGKGTLSISDGYFKEMVDYEDCATGYYPIKTSRGKYTVEKAKGTLVASVGTGDDIEFCTSFKTAASKADGDVITLLADIDTAYSLTNGETLKVKKGKKTLSVTTSVPGKSVKSQSPRISGAETVSVL